MKTKEMTKEFYLAESIKCMHELQLVVVVVCFVGGKEIFE